MADKIIILDDEESPKPSPSESTSSSEHQDKKISPLKAQQPVATHITQSPFASAKKHTHVLQAENQKLFTEVRLHHKTYNCHIFAVIQTAFLHFTHRLILFLTSPLQFVEHCSPQTKDCPEVLTFLQNRHAKASPDYLSSVEFRNTLGRCLTRAQAKLSKTFVYINELCTVLKQHATKKRQQLCKAEPGPSTSASNTSQSTLVLKSKDKTKGTMDEEDEGMKLAADEEKPSTSGLQEDNKEEDPEAEKKAKRASRKQVSVHFLAALIVKGI